MLQIDSQSPQPSFSLYFASNLKSLSQLVPEIERFMVLVTQWSSGHLQ